VFSVIVSCHCILRSWEVWPLAWQPAGEMERRLCPGWRTGCGSGSGRGILRWWGLEEIYTIL